MAGPHPTGALDFLDTCYQLINILFFYFPETTRSSSLLLSWRQTGTNGLLNYGLKYWLRLVFYQKLSTEVVKPMTLSVQHPVRAEGELDAAFIELENQFFK